MKRFTHNQRGRRIASLMAVFLCGMLALSGAAWALTPAGTEIRNQSVATYEDSEGNDYTTTSNEVITVVEEVYSFEITPNKTGGTAAPGNFDGTQALEQYAAPGNTVYYSYYLTNTGNAPDTYQLSRLNGTNATHDDIDPVADTSTIYFDANGNGQVDPGDTLLTPGGTADDITVFGGISTPAVDPDETISLLVAYEVPTTAADGDTIDVDIDGRSDGDNTVTDDVGNFSTTTVENQRGILTVYKEVNVTSANAGDTLTYTIRGSNTGNSSVYGRDHGNTLIDLDDPANGAEQRSGVLITDMLDSKLDFATVSMDNPATPLPNEENEFSPNKATVVYQAQGSSTWVADKPAGNIQGIGLFIPDDDDQDTGPPPTDIPDPALDPGQGFKLVFYVAIQDPLDNTTIINNATALFYDDTVPEDREKKSNDVRTDIGGEGSTTADVEIGPMTEPQATHGGISSPGNFDHPLIDDPYTPTAETLTSAAGTPDVLESGARDAGQTVVFVNTIANTGGGTDTFDITVEDTNGRGWDIGLYKSDGLTPLTDTDGDGVPDTGPLAAAGEYDVVVKVYIPADQADLAATSDFTVTATSSILVDDDNDPATAMVFPSDTTIDQVTSVSAAGVDIAQKGQTGDGDNTAGDDDPAQQDGTPGEYVDFPLDVENVRAADGSETGAPDTYDITTTLPADYVVEYFRDLDGDGVLDDNELIPLLNTNNLNPEEIDNLIARVYVPEGEAAGVDTITVTATSTNNPTDIPGGDTDVDDSVDLAINVENICLIKIEPDNNRTSVRGGVVSYEHEVTNVGNTTESWTLSIASSAGYNAVFVQSDGTNIGPDATIAAGGDYDTGAAHLAPGESVTIYVKVFIPTNAPVGTKDVQTITVDDTAGDATCPADSALDITTVIEGNLELTKSRDQATVLPTLTSDGAGGPPANFYPITYTTVYKNRGVEPLSNMEIVDAIPANTRIVIDNTGGGTVPNGTLPDDSDPTAGGAVTITYSDDGGLSYDTLANLGITPETDYSAPSVTHIKFTIGAVGPGQTGQVIFQVLVD